MKRQVELNGQKWTIDDNSRLRKVRGEADKKKKLIRISSRCRERKDYLEVFIHECLHACCWDLSEETVSFSAREIADAIEAFHGPFNPSGDFYAEEETKHRG